MESCNIKISLWILGYTILGWLFFFIVFPVFFLFSCLTGKHRKDLHERLGFYRSANYKGSPRIWLHAASVGEARAAHKLLHAIRKRKPEGMYFITTVTKQGKEVAQALVGETALVFLAPLDFPFAVDRAIKCIRPDIFVLLETELWPQLLHRLHRAGVNIFLTNGRISTRSFGRYRLLGTFMGYLLGLFREISAIGLDDAKRFITLGADPDHLHVTGNIKLDPTDQRPGGEELPVLREDLGLADRSKVFFCGSTRSGEEELLLLAYQQLKTNIPDLLWFIAPRHLERLGEIEALLIRNGIEWQRLSHCRSTGRKAEVILIDTMGELKTLYGLGTYVFCGGSLVAKGGHNIMEPVAWGKPVYYGPSMNDFADAKILLETHGIGFEVDSAEQLSNKISELDRKPELYKELCKKAKDLAGLQQKIADRQAELIASAF